jgi:hypothetical protein
VGGLGLGWAVGVQAWECVGSGLLSWHLEGRAAQRRCEAEEGLLERLRIAMLKLYNAVPRGPQISPQSTRNTSYKSTAHHFLCFTPSTQPRRRS